MPVGSSRVSTSLNIPVAIPDSEADQKLVHRYVLDDVNGTVADSIGNADATNNGVVSVSGDYAGGSAGDGNGTDQYIAFPSAISTWISNLNSGRALALTIDNYTDDGDSAFGTSEGSTEFVNLLTNPRSEASGKIGVDIRNGGDTGDPELTYAANDTNINDGNPYRIVFNWPSGIDDSNVEIWINQSEESINVIRSSSGVGDLYTPSYDPYLFARNNQGTADPLINTVIDDVCFFNDSLTSSEIQSYTNPWE